MILGQSSDSDLLIHHCGPSSFKRRSVIGEIDRRLREISACYGDDVTWVIIGDHGMTDVIEEVDVAGEVAMLEKKAGVRHGQDYLLFLIRRWRDSAVLPTRAERLSPMSLRQKYFSKRVGLSTERWLSDTTFPSATVVTVTPFGGPGWERLFSRIISMTIILIIRECMVTIPNMTI